MSKDFNYISANAALNVSLTRQSYGPLDGSSVFKSLSDLNYYIVASHNKEALLTDSTLSSLYANADGFWKYSEQNKSTTYAYVGQVVSVVENGKTKVYKITDVPNALSDVPVVGGVPSCDGFYEQIDGVNGEQVSSIVLDVLKAWMRPIIEKSGGSSIRDVLTTLTSINDF